MLNVTVWFSEMSSAFTQPDDGAPETTTSIVRTSVRAVAVTFVATMPWAFFLRPSAVKDATLVNSAKSPVCPVRSVQ